MSLLRPKSRLRSASEKAKHRWGRAAALCGVFLSLLFPEFALTQQQQAAVQPPPATSMTPQQAVQPAPAAPAATTPTSRPLSASLEFGAGFTYDGNKNWDGPFVRADVQQNAKTGWSVELARAGSFGDTGMLMIAGLTRDFNPKWYADFAVASSREGFFLPAVSANSTLHRKWLHDHMATSFGGGYDRFKDHTNQYRWGGSVSYRLKRPWEFNAGIGFARSDALPVTTRSQFVGVTEGHDKKRLLSLRATFGYEAYQIIGGDTSIADFQSHEISVRVQQWVRPGWGFAVGAAYYSNPYYQRKGAEVSFFKNFGGQKGAR